MAAQHGSKARAHARRTHQRGDRQRRSRAPEEIDETLHERRDVALKTEKHTGRRTHKLLKGPWRMLLDSRNWCRRSFSPCATTEWCTPALMSMYTCMCTTYLLLVGDPKYTIKTRTKQSTWHFGKHAHALVSMHMLSFLCMRQTWTQVLQQCTTPSQQKVLLLHLQN